MRFSPLCYPEGIICILLYSQEALVLCRLWTGFFRCAYFLKSEESLWSFFRNSTHMGTNIHKSENLYSARKKIKTWEKYRQDIRTVSYPRNLRDIKIFFPPTTARVYAPRANIDRSRNKSSPSYNTHTHNERRGAAAAFNSPLNIEDLFLIPATRQFFPLSLSPISPCELSLYL